MRKRNILAALLLLALCLRGVGTRALPAGGGGIVQLPDAPAVVALTFDDGPRSDATQRLLDGLALREVQATFFLVGSRIEGKEALICRMAAEGHQIGVHSWSHTILSGLSQADFDAEVGRTRRALAGILGERDFWLRPPYGFYDEEVRGRAGSPVILWSVDPEDWREDHDARRIARAVLEKARDGDIILLHDVYQTSVDAALEIVDTLSEMGFCFATVEQLLKMKGISAEDGGVYTSAR